MIWKTLLSLALGALAKLIIAYITNLKALSLDNPELITVVDDIIKTAADSDKTNAQKRSYAISELKKWGAAWGKDISDSLAATSIELGVQRLKLAEVKEES